MFSKEVLKQAEACRFCWMCRHICPVAGSTGNESWTPRAKGLLISLTERGAAFDADMADAMYHCTLCDACANDCATGFRPSEFIRAARTEALVEGVAPACVEKALETLAQKGNIFGKDEAFAVEGSSDGAGLLLYLGQTARYACPETGRSAAELLRRADVAFTVLENEPDSGAFMAELMGYTGEVQQTAARAAEAIKASGASTVAVLDPADAQIFKEQYVQWGLLQGIKLVTFTSLAAELIREGRFSPSSAEGMKFSLQEPVKLVRGLDEEQPALELLAALGADEKQMFLHGKMSRCVGTVPFDIISPETVREMVRVRVGDAARMGSEAVVTASPDDFYLMKKYARGMKIVDLFALLCGRR